MLTINPTVVNQRHSGTPLSHHLIKYGSQELQHEIVSNSNTNVNMISYKWNLVIHEYAYLSVEAFKTVINREDFQQINHYRGNGTHLHYLLSFPEFGAKQKLKAILMINHPKINLKLKNKYEKTVLDIAREKGLSDMITIIESKIKV